MGLERTRSASPHDSRGVTNRRREIVGGALMGVGTPTCASGYIAQRVIRRSRLDSEDLAKTVLSEMMKRHILINRTSETVLRFLPPFILRQEHVDQGIAALNEILTEQLAHTAATPIPGGKKIGN